MRQFFLEESMKILILGTVLDDETIYRRFCEYQSLPQRIVCVSIVVASFSLNSALRSPQFNPYFGSVGALAALQFPEELVQIVVPPNLEAVLPASK